MTDWWIALLVIFGIATTTVCSKNQHDDNRILSGLPEFLLEIEKNSDGGGLSRSTSGNKRLLNPKNGDLKNLIKNNNNKNKLCKQILQSSLNDYNDLDQMNNNNWIKNQNTIDDLDDLMHSVEIQNNNEKRGNLATSSLGCDCQIKNDVVDLGYSHFPRYLFNAVCQEGSGAGSKEGGGGSTRDGKKLHSKKCWRGECKPVEYKVRVLTYRTRADILEKDHTSSLLPDILRPDWKWKTVTVAAGCFCSF